MKNKEVESQASYKTFEVTEITNDEKKKLEEIITTNIIEIANVTNKVNNTIIQEIFSENIDIIVNEIEK